MSLQFGPTEIAVMGAIRFEFRTLAEIAETAGISLPTVRTCIRRWSGNAPAVRAHPLVGGDGFEYRANGRGLAWLRWAADGQPQTYSIDDDLESEQ